MNIGGGGSGSGAAMQQTHLQVSVPRVGASEVFDPTLVH